MNNVLTRLKSNAHLLLYCKGDHFPGQSDDLHVCFRSDKAIVDKSLTEPGKILIPYKPLFSDIKNNPWDAVRFVHYSFMMIFRESYPEEIRKLVTPESCFALSGENELWSYNLVVSSKESLLFYSQSIVSDKLFLLPSLRASEIKFLFEKTNAFSDLVNEGFEYIKSTQP